MRSGFQLILGIGALILAGLIASGLGYFILTNPSQSGIIVADRNPHSGFVGQEVDIIVSTKSFGNVTVYSVSNCFRPGDHVTVSKDIQGGWSLSSPDIEGSC